MSFKVQTVGIQKQPIKSYGKRNMPLRIEASNHQPPALVEFDVAVMAHPVLSRGRLNSNGYMFSFYHKELRAWRKMVCKDHVAYTISDTVDEASANGTGQPSGRGATKKGTRSNDVPSGMVKQNADSRADTLPLRRLVRNVRAVGGEKQQGALGGGRTRASRGKGADAPQSHAKRWQDVQ